jgi:hypothetical protein
VGRSEGTYVFHLSRPTRIVGCRGQPDKGHITRGSLDARLRRVSYERMSSDWDAAGILERSMKSGPLIRVRTARVGSGLEKKKLTKLTTIQI